MIVPNRVLARLQSIFELQAPAQNRMLPMEGLRGFAVSLVFLQHYTTQALLIGMGSGWTASLARAFSSYGNLGVELFFVLSGYLIYGTLIRKRPPFVSFMARRLQRIYPAFAVVFALALALTVAVPIPGKIPSEPLTATLYLIENLTFVAGLVPMPRIVDVAWSLSYEMFFYIVTAVIVLQTRLSELSNRSRTGALAATSVAFLVLAAFASPGFPSRMMPFFAGMLLAEGAGQRIPAWLGLAAPPVGFALLISQSLPGVSGELAQTIAFFCLCAVCFRNVGAVSCMMRWTPLRWLGNMSYSYYLIHGFVVRIFMVLLAHRLPHGMADWLFWIVLPILYVATLAVASILFVVVEKPLSLQPAPKRVGVALT